MRVCGRGIRRAVYRRENKKGAGDRCNATALRPPVVGGPMGGVSPLGCFSDRCDPEPRRRERVVAPMRVVVAAVALFLDVRDLAARRDLPVMTGDAPA